MQVPLKCLSYSCYIRQTPLALAQNDPTTLEYSGIFYRGDFSFNLTRTHMIRKKQYPHSESLMYFTSWCEISPFCTIANPLKSSRAISVLAVDLLLENGPSFHIKMLIIKGIRFPNSNRTFPLITRY